MCLAMVHVISDMVMFSNVSGHGACDLRHEQCDYILYFYIEYIYLHILSLTY